MSAGRRPGTSGSVSTGGARPTLPTTEQQTRPPLTESTNNNVGNGIVAGRRSRPRRDASIQSELENEMHCPYQETIVRMRRLAAIAMMKML